MQRLVDRIPPRRLGAALRAIHALPPSALRRLAGPPIHRDGQQLATEAQLLIRFAATAGTGLVRENAQRSREQLTRSTAVIGGLRVEPVGTRELTIPGRAGDLASRLYIPDEAAPGGPLLVFYHGGGWVLGDLDTHDNLCRFLAVHAGLRVLALDYRLAPEHPFPAAVDDARAAYRYAREHADELGIDARAIALGGDSAGGTLAAVTALDAAGHDLPVPAFLLLFYPVTDATVRRRSRDLFGDGFLLTDEEMTWFADQCVPDIECRSDPRVSPLRAADLSVLPPTYLATAGFDPLRDEGAAFGRALADAGVPVVHRCHTDLFHGFANGLAVPRFRAAVLEAAAGLRTGLALGRAAAPAPEP